MRYALFADPAGQEDRTDIGITFKPGGALVIDGCYSGPIALRMYGDWDHEFWLTIPAKDAPRFLALVLARAFQEEGRLSYAVLDELCREAGIEAERASYS